jgi:hypothetical protein
MSRTCAVRLSGAPRPASPDHYRYWPRS